MANPNTHIVQHPRRAAAIERAIANSPEAEKLQNEICRAVAAYGDFLDEHGLFSFDAFLDGIGAPPVLAVHYDFEDVDFILEGTAVEAELASGQFPYISADFRKLLDDDDRAKSEILDAQAQSRQRQLLSRQREQST